MLFPAYYWAWPEMQILISDHRDGELIAQVVGPAGLRRRAGLDHAGGARALREMTHRVDRGHLCVTPDGPRGPRRHVHQGLAYLSSRTGLPIVGAGMAFRRPWRAKSWDRFAVPGPSPPPPASSRPPSSSPPTPTATCWKPAAWKSSGGCRPPRARPRPGSRNCERDKRPRAVVAWKLDPAARAPGRTDGTATR